MPEESVPVQRIGTLTLIRTPNNYLQKQDKLLLH
ncbi:hypothetical protein [Chitinophaga sancti]